MANQTVPNSETIAVLLIYYTKTRTLVRQGEWIPSDLVDRCPKKCHKCAMKSLSFSARKYAALVVAAGSLVVACSADPVQTPPVFGATGGGSTIAGSGGATGTGGAVAPTCAAGTADCGAGCVSLATDGANCGQCGTVCASGTVCDNSICAASCSVGSTLCGQSCADIATDPNHCGACNSVCSGTCVAGACQAPPPAAGGTTATGGAPNATGGAVNTTGGAAATTGGATAAGGAATTGGATGTGGGTQEPLGGYHVHGDWAGFAFTFEDGGATITPADFNDMVTQDGPYCVSGTVQGTEDYSSIAAVGVNTSQPKISDAPVGTTASTGDGLAVDLTVNGGDDGIRIQIEDDTPPDDPDAAEHRWCVNLSGSQSTVIPWDTFNTECWDAESGTPYDGRPIAKVIAYVPDPGDGAGPLDFDFCLNDIGPDNVTGRGEGEIVSSCGNNVSWASSGTSEQYANIASSDNRYQVQSNGWGWTGGGSHSISTLSGGGFRMDTQSCSRDDSSPCSFPSIYIGTDADGERTSNSGLPVAISGINSLPTCLGWSSGGTPATDEYNVSYDVWFNSNAQATYAEKFLMVWFRDPPSFQPGGMFPAQDGVVIGGQTWSVWFGPNADGQDVVSYVAPNYRADGQAYSFDLKDFIDDAVERGYLQSSLNLIAVMGGMEIWGGGQGASIDGFRAEVQ